MSIEVAGRGRGRETPGREFVDEEDIATERQDKSDDRPNPSTRSGRGLDWLVFFVADVQTGFGPFVAVFLTTQKWTQADIGFALTVSGLVSLFGQVPLGILVDAAKSLRFVAALSLVAIGLSAFVFADWPNFPIVIFSRVVYAVASCLLGLALVAISLGLAGEGAASERFGRNAAFASAGTGIAAAAMGACGVYLSNRAVFYLTGLLVIPALFALSRIDAREIGPASDAARGAPTNMTSLVSGVGAMARNGPFVAFAFCIMMFHLANAAMLPLAAGMVTLRSSQEAATVMVAAAIVVPQFTMTAISQTTGRWAHLRGRRPVLVVGFGALALRALLFSLISSPPLLVLVQILDGVSAAALAVLVPLTMVDLTRASGHFNLAQGIAGCAMGIGAAASTTLAGFISDRFGSNAAFNTLAAIAACGFLAVVLIMPETKPRETRPRSLLSR